MVCDVFLCAASMAWRAQTHWHHALQQGCWGQIAHCPDPSWVVQTQHKVFTVHHSWHPVLCITQEEALRLQTSAADKRDAELTAEAAR